MAKIETKTGECGYFYLTICALLVAVVSAGLTLLIASYMYHGNYNSVEFPSTKASTRIKQLIIPTKKLALFKMEANNRCYVIPAAEFKKIFLTKDNFIGVPLSQEVLLDVTGLEGVHFCGQVPAFVLEKS